MSGHIDDLTQMRIKDAADSHIVDIIGSFLDLRNGSKGTYDALCPFHADENLGNFKVSSRKGVAKCFSCGWTGDAIKFLMDFKNMTYPEALEWVAKEYGIVIDESPKPYTANRTYKRPKAAKPIITFPMEWVRQRMKQDGNTLIDWLHSLPWFEDERKMLDEWLKLYAVGTVHGWKINGWTCWWYIDKDLKVRTGKIMAYKPDGHRAKDINPYIDNHGKQAYYTRNWIHYMTDRAANKGKGWWDSRTSEYKLCLFGEHLMNAFPDAEVCIVESEKTAVIAQTASNPAEKLFMATGGLTSLTRETLAPLIQADRSIVLYPDYDGWDKWQEQAKEINYHKLTVSDRIKRLHRADDGPKADIADIIIRHIESRRTASTAELATEKLGLPAENENLTNLIDTFQLTLTK